MSQRRHTRRRRNIFIGVGAVMVATIALSIYLRSRPAAGAGLPEEQEDREETLFQNALRDYETETRGESICVTYRSSQLNITKTRKFHISTETTSDNLLFFPNIAFPDGPTFHTRKCSVGSEIQLQKCEPHGNWFTIWGIEHLEPEIKNRSMYLNVDAVPSGKEFTEITPSKSLKLADTVLSVSNFVIGFVSIKIEGPTKLLKALNNKGLHIENETENELTVVVNLIGRNEIGLSQLQFDGSGESALDYKSWAMFIPQKDVASVSHDFSCCTEFVAQAYFLSKFCYWSDVQLSAVYDGPVWSKMWKIFRYFVITNDWNDSKHKDTTDRWKELPGVFVTRRTSIKKCEG